MNGVRKHSKKRDAILDCVRGTDTHPSAEWVYSRLKPQIPDLSLRTLYRNLALFKEYGEIVSLGTIQGLERFDGRTFPHTHFICTRCGRIRDLTGIEVPGELISQAEALVEAPIGTCRLTFSGICPDCAPEQENQ